LPLPFLQPKFKISNLNLTASYIGSKTISVNIEEAVRDKNLIKVYWKEKKKEIDFEAKDENGNGLIDKIEWVIPESELGVSEQTFEIIIITKAEHLDSNREFVEDVYEEVKARDNIWAKIPDQHYLRIKFEKNLTSENDITIYARGNGRVEVYEKNSDEEIAEFFINGEKEYKILLINLQESQDTFDLRVLSKQGVEIDYVVDPTTGGSSSGGLRPQSLTCYDDGVAGACDGSYPSSCPVAGGSDYLSCNDGNEESHETRKGDFAEIQGTYYNSSITDCLEITKVELCYEWSSDTDDPSDCFINIDNDEDNTWTGVVSTCPGTAGASGCVDVTNDEGGWNCEDFFGATYDFQMIVPENGLPDFNGATAYYIYIELGGS